MVLHLQLSTNFAGLFVDCLLHCTSQIFFVFILYKYFYFTHKVSLTDLFDWKWLYLFEGHVPVEKHLILMIKKSPFASPGRGFNPSLRKKGISGISSKKSFSTIFLIRKKSHRFSKTPEGDLIIPSKRRIKSWLQWDLNWSGKKRW